MKEVFHLPFKGLSICRRLLTSVEEAVDVLNPPEGRTFAVHDKSLYRILYIKKCNTVEERQIE